MKKKATIIIIVIGIAATIAAIVSYNLKKKPATTVHMDGKTKEELIAEVDNLAANPNNLPGLNSLIK